MLRSYKDKTGIGITIKNNKVRCRILKSYDPDNDDCYVILWVRRAKQWEKIREGYSIFSFDLLCDVAKTAAASYRRFGDRIISSFL